MSRDISLKVTFSADLIADIREASRLSEFAQVKLIRRYLTQGVAADLARLRAGILPWGVVSPPVPAPAAEVKPEPKFESKPEGPAGLRALQRGPVFWFELNKLCAAYGIDEESVRGLIDPEDDLLDYMGKTWADTVTLKHCKTLAGDSARALSVSAWIESASRTA